jgi:hypothetical protein
VTGSPGGPLKDRPTDPYVSHRESSPRLQAWLLVPDRAQCKRPSVDKPAAPERAVDEPGKLLDNPDRCVVDGIWCSGHIVGTSIPPLLPSPFGITSFQPIEAIDGVAVQRRCSAVCARNLACHGQSMSCHTSQAGTRPPGSAQPDRRPRPLAAA